MDKLVVHRLSHPQKRIWYTEQLYPQSSVNHIGGCVRILRPIHFNALEASIHSVIQANEGLRIQLQLRHDEPVQYVAPYQEEPLPFYDFSEISDSQAAYERWVTAEAQTPYNLYDSPLYHIAMFSLGERDNGFLLRAHHLICDGWSMDVLTKHILERYQLLSSQEASDPMQPCTSYLQYLDMEQAYLQSDRCENNRIYWEQKFTQLPEPLFEQTPRDPSGNRLTRLLDKETTSRLKDAADQHHVSVPIFLSAAYGILLSRYYQKDEIVLSMPIANRNAMTKTIVGMFTDNLPLTIRMQEDRPLHDFLRDLKREYMRNLGNHKYPYNLLAGRLQLRKKGRQALAQTSLNYYNTHLRTSIHGSPILNEEFYSGEQAYPLQLVIKDWSDDGTLLFSLDYQTSLIDDFEAESLLDSMICLLAEMASSPDARIHRLSLLNQQQWENTVEHYNLQAAHKYAEDLTVLDLFEREASVHPERTALSWEQEEMTYGQLWRQVHHLAAVLAAKPGIQSGPIAIRMRHSPELVVAIMAVIKTGTAFMPIALEIPRSRVEFMLRDSGAVYLLSDEETEEWTVPVLTVPGLLAQNEAVEEKQLSAFSESTVSKANTPAYIIYTSGSTGEPKGVQVLHSSLANYITWASSVYLKSDRDIFAFYSSLSFDLTLTSLFVPLTSGIQLRIYPPNQHEFTLSRILQDNKATIIKLTPSHLALFPNRRNPNAVVHTLIVGGESLKTHLASQIQAMFGSSLSIYNEYGPTEATVGCMIHRFNPLTDKESAVPIGIPAANARLYILDKHMQMLPPGAVGELFISGPGVAEGYLHRHQLTAERFLADPYVEGNRMYRTGDRVRMGKGYLLQYIGRMDDQVKIRGYRIEPEEIEQALLRLEGIREAVVFITGEDQSAELLACVDGDEPDSAWIRQQLLGSLPSYMIPDRIHSVPAIPLTLNGKADKQQLTEMMNKGHSPSVQQEPLTYSGNLLAAMRTVLETDNIEIEDQFFERGGDSIKAIQVSSLLKSQGFDLSAAVILDYPLLKDMLLHLKQEFHEEEQGPAVGELLPTPIQSWFLKQQFQNADYYQQSIMLELADDIAEADLVEGIRSLIRHHDAFRLYYDDVRKKMFYSDNLHLGEELPEIIHINAHSEEQQEIELEQKMTAFKRKIRFTSADKPCLQALLITVPGRKRRLLLAAHHLCIDGVSWRILLEDLKRVLSKQPLPPKTASFQRWSSALWERSQPIFQSELDYWKRQSEANKRIKEAEERPMPLRSDCFKRKIIFSADETQAILQGNCGMTTAEHMQTELALAWQGEFPSEELTIWTEGHGREALFADLNLSRTIGWFTSLYPVKLKFDTELEERGRRLGLQRQLKQVPHRGVGYGVLAYSLQQLTPASPGIVFNYLGEFSIQDEEKFRVLYEASGPDVAPENHFPYLLELNAVVMKRQLQIEFMVSPEAMELEQMERLIQGYRSKMMKLIQEPAAGAEEELILTPDDFDAVDLTQQELDAIFK
ncbi:non-ribosomal peptide synthetase [Paenibacillus zanthoxyli]|uniref:non-ribosomal peptide synthetase n=1 Tax=Paenibacillus zanthoxyli TaxID=369399 RepID=UPI0018DB47A8|nr:non-ribosomal peptide synthetase [Paenibacillus zanthoxyli]